MKKFLTTALGLATVRTVAAACSGGTAVGEFNVAGQPQMYLNGQGGTVAGDALTIQHGAGFTVFNACKQDWAPESIAQFKLLGKAMTFTVDLSKAGCACNLAFYLISMPAKGPNGQFSEGADRGGQPAFYCDANKVGGQWCPEIDIMEANTHAFQTTPHKCDAPQNGAYYYCDRGGCGENTRTMGNKYGPGPQFDIDTSRPFDVRTEFPETNGVWVGFKTILIQGAKQVVMEHRSCAADYLKTLTDALKQGMSLRITYWGEGAQTMSWLDAPPCGSESCAASAGPAVISKVVVSDLGAPAPIPGSVAPVPAAAPKKPAPTAATGCVGGLSKGQLEIKGYSQKTFLYGTGGSVSRDRLTINHDAGFTVFDSCPETWAPESIAQFKLLGKAITFTVDLSQVGCACNLAFYLISSPAKLQNGVYSVGDNRGGQPEYYCDANKVGGQWCPEIDIMEANDHAFQTTPHSCDAPVGTQYMNCDRGGCSENTKAHGDSYGPGPGYKIDTTKSFNVRTEFTEANGQWTGYKTILMQGSNQVVMEHGSCSQEYLHRLTAALKEGMALRITYWGAGAQIMSWLDTPPCGGADCAASAGPAVISGIHIDDLSVPPPAVISDAPAPHALPQPGGAGGCVGGIAKGPLTIGGVPGTFLNGNGGTVSGRRLNIDHNSGFTVFNKCEKDFVPESIQQFKLLGQAITYTVDLSKVGCGCNLAFYLIGMPARAPGGGYSAGDNRGGQPAYYCDANKVGGQWCPEIDIMEANDHAFQATPHKCDPDQNGVYNNCDRGGCSANSKSQPNAYGPGAGYTINTQLPFEVRTEFHEAGGRWTKFVTLLKQSGKQVSIDGGCAADYLGALTPKLSEGMSLRITYWGAGAETMAWLDTPPCGGVACDASAGTAVISDIHVASLATPEHHSPAAPPAVAAGAAASPPGECVDGIAKGKYAIGGMPSTFLNGNGGTVQGSHLRIRHDAGFTVMSQCEKEWVPESIAQFKLLGKAITFTVDLSQVGCACNLAFYLISAPARSLSGGFSAGDNRGGQPPFYCDANMVGGQWCPEIDIMEANTHAFQATPHSCEAPENGHYSFCDRSGCAASTKTMGSAYGPGSGFKIDTTRPFKVRTEFNEVGGAWASMQTIFIQGGTRVSMDHSNCDARYLHKLTDALREGMALRITYWGAGANIMQWLDSPPCGGVDCSASAGPADIYDVHVEDLGETGAPHAPLTPKPALAPVPVAQAAQGPPATQPHDQLGALAIGGMRSTYLAGNGGVASGDTLTISHNAGTSIFKNANKEWTADSFTQFQLLGKTISFTVDLSKVGCACNLAFYLIAVPAMNFQGLPNRGSNRGGQPPYYCDANQVGGQWCPEIDIMEANNAAFQATLHRCDAPQNKHYQFCDRGGCAQNTRDIANAYGPDSGFRINTLLPFEVITEFPANNGILTGMRTFLKQHGETVPMMHQSCNPSYLAQLSKNLAEGMSLRITYWGDQGQMMSWMDVPPCAGGAACAGGNAIISKITVSEGGSFSGAAGPHDFDMIMKKFSPSDVMGTTAGTTTEEGTSFTTKLFYLAFILLFAGFAGRFVRRGDRTFNRERQESASYSDMDTGVVKVSSYSSNGSGGKPRQRGRSRAESLRLGLLESQADAVAE